MLGSVVTTTGPLAATGLNVLWALQMAEEDVNAAGGINGKRLRIVNEDAGSANSTAVSALVKLMQETDPEFVFYSSYSPQTLAAAEEIRRAQVPVVHAGGAIAIEELDNPYIFRIKPSDTTNTRGLVKLVLDELGFEKPGVLFVQNDYGQGYANEMIRLFAERGIDIPVASYGPMDNDMSAQLQSLMAQDIDVLLPAGFVRDSALVLRSRKALGLNIPVVGNQALGVSATIALADPEELAGVIALVDAYLPDRMELDRADMFTRYAERHGIEPDPSFITNYYDSVWLLKDVIEQVGEDRAAIRDALENLEGWEGFTRTYRTNAKRNMSDEVVLVRYDDNKVYTPICTYTEGVDTLACAPGALDDLKIREAVRETSALAAFVQSVFNGLSIGSIYALMALGFVLVYAATGVVNFAAGQMVVVGALLGVTGATQLAMSADITILWAVLSMAALGVLFFLAVYRPLQNSPIVTIIVGTIAVGIIINNISLNIWGPQPLRLESPFGTQPFLVGGVALSAHTLAIIGITAAVVAALSWLLYGSGLGAKMRAVAQDPEAARLMGINAMGLTAFTWGLAAALAGLAGVMMAPVWFVDVSMGDGLALKAFAATIIGGFGSVPGAILGGILVGLTEMLGAAYISAAYKDAIVFGVMIAFLLFKPEGLFGEDVGDRA